VVCVVWCVVYGVWCVLCGVLFLNFGKIRNRYLDI